MTVDQNVIRKGRWCYWSIDELMPRKLTVYEGDWEHRRKVGAITRYQAMAYYRHWSNGGLCHSVKGRNGRWRDIHVCGDVDAFYGDD